MSKQTDPVTAAIDDARALMDALLEHGWKQVHVASEGLEIFIAREDGGPNPMLEPAVPARDVEVGPEFTIEAPHVGTFDWAVTAGQLVSIGEVVAKLSLLDEAVEILSDCSGVVRSVLAKAGDLVEFGQQLVIIEERG